MVSPNTSTDFSSSDSMEDKEKRFYNRTPQAPPSTSLSGSESESESESDQGSPVLSQKNPQPIPTNKNLANSPKPSNSKRPREEEQSRGLEKNKKPKEVKKPPPLDAPKQSEKKTSEDKKRVKKSESPPKTAKKNGPVWNAQDEIGFLKDVLAYQTSKGLPRTNMTPVYDYIRKLNRLEHEYSNNQMSDKLRRLKAKYAAFKDKINAGDFSFKTPHEEVLYKLCRKIWGSGEEDEDESTDEENGADGVEEDNKKSKGQVVEMVQKEKEEEEEEDDEDEDEGNLVSNGGQKQSKESSSKENKKPSVVSDVVVNNGSSMSPDKLIDLLQKKNMAMMKDCLAREKEEIRKEVKEMVREGLRNSVSSGSGDSGQFSREDMIKRISFSRELPTLEKAEAERLELKWQRQHLIDLDASSKRLQLLQEECQLRMEKLRSLVEEKNA